jgi:hypothetical protein
MSWKKAASIKHWWSVSGHSGAKGAESLNASFLASPWTANKGGMCDQTATNLPHKVKEKCSPTDNRRLKKCRELRESLITHKEVLDHRLSLAHL